MAAAAAAVSAGATTVTSPLNNHHHQQQYSKPGGAAVSAAAVLAAAAAASGAGHLGSNSLASVAPNGVTTSLCSTNISSALAATAMANPQQLQNQNAAPQTQLSSLQQLNWLNYLEENLLAAVLAAASNAAAANQEKKKQLEIVSTNHIENYEQLTCILYAASL